MTTTTWTMATFGTLNSVISNLIQVFKSGNLNTRRSDVGYGWAISRTLALPYLLCWWQRPLIYKM